MQKKARFQLRMSIGKTMFGDIKPNNFKAWFKELHFVKEKSLATPNIKHARTGFESVCIDESLGNRLPSACEILVTAVTEATITIPIIELIFFGFNHTSHFIIHHAGEHIAIVTHGLVLDSAYRAATGLALDAQRPVPLVNASLNWFAFDGSRWSAGAWGDAEHLGPDGVTIFGDRRI